MNLLARFLGLVAALMLIQGVVFAYWYRDLLALNRPARTLAADPEGFSDVAARALGRQTLTRRHLEAIADGARLASLQAAEVEALGRLALAFPNDLTVRLRYADSLRLAGRLGDAEREYQAILGHGQTVGATR